MVDQRIGNYRIVRKLGEGGMGVVFEVVHEYIGRRAAVKVLHADFSRNPEMAVRFLNEARAANIVQHPGIVNIFEFDRLPDGSAYIVMDYLDGDSLTQRLAKHGGHLDVNYALQLAWQIAEALAAAHGKGVIHRDLKPDNIMIVGDPNDASREQAKILDFGIAKVAESQGLGPTLVKTQIGVPMGTPLYMAPEQWKGASEVEDKADVYSLGVILYEMLAGQPPFIANSSSEVMALHILAAPRPIRDLNPLTPDEVAALLHQMLAKSPPERPTMIQVARELRRLAGVNIEYSLSGVKNPLLDPSAMSGARSGNSQVGPMGHLLAAGNASSSQIGQVQFAGSSQLGAMPSRQSGGMGAGPSVAAAEQVSDNTGANARAPSGTEKLQRRALYVVIGLCVVAMVALGVKILGKQPPPPAAPVQTQFESSGMVWNEVPSSTTQNLQDVWGTASNNLWAVGKSGTILRWNGATWAEVSGVPTKAILNAIWGSGTDDIWAVGKDGVTVHWNGVSWSEVASGSREQLKDVWGSGRDNVWAVGEAGVILHWNGNDWSPMSSGSEIEMRGIWGSGPSDIWAVGGSDASDGIILHWNGTAWKPWGKTETRLNAVWGSSADSVWAVGGRFGPEGTVHHWDGKTWEQVRIPRAAWLNSIWGSGPQDVWIVGDSGTILHWNGTVWAEAVSSTQMTFKGVYGTGANDVWAVAVGGLLRHWNGKQWLQMPAVTGQSLEHVFGTSQTDVWAVGKAGTIAHWDGKAWGVMPSGVTNDLHGVTAGGTNDLWACGDKGSLLHYTGKGWEAVASGSQANLHAISALDASDIWAVGDKGAVLHYDGKAWTAVPSETEINLSAVFGIEHKDVWAGGDQGYLAHWNGSAWAKVPVESPNPRAIYSLYGSQGDSVWASGARGWILHWNGRTFSEFPSGTTEDLYGLFGNGKFDVWAVGSGGVILHWSGGTTWAKILSPTKKTLQGLWSSRPGDMWVVGEFGMILH